jgi:hypothetical protein
LPGTRTEGYTGDKGELAWPSFGADEYTVIKCCVLGTKVGEEVVDSGGGRGGGGGGGGAFFLPSLTSWTKPGKCTKGILFSITTLPSLLVLCVPCFLYTRHKIQ